MRAGYDVSSLRNMIHGAAPCPPEVIEFFHGIGLPLGELWGMSETNAIGACNPPEKVKIGLIPIADVAPVFVGIKQGYFKEQGIELDPQKNQVRGKEEKISKVESRAEVWIVPTNEELIVARQTVAVLSGETNKQPAAASR